MTRLSVNINKVAVLRNTRSLGIPSVIWAAQTAIEAGAYGITVHPRPDERHIRYTDVYELKEIVRNVEFNIEGNPFEGRYMQLMPDVRPTQATLVPDSINAVTSNQGWDLQNKENQRKLIPIIKELHDLGIRASIFVEPVWQVVEIAKEIGADRVELYTEHFASAFARKEGLQQQIEQYSAAGKKAVDLGLGLNAGHDLSLENLGFFCKNVKSVDEVSIGHALVADALKMGLQNAVKEYLKILAHTGD